MTDQKRNERIPWPVKATSPPFNCLLCLSLIILLRDLGTGVEGRKAGAGPKVHHLGGGNL